MLDEREKGSRAFIEAAVKTSETNMAGKFDMLRRLLGGYCKIKSSRVVLDVDIHFNIGKCEYLQ